MLTQILGWVSENLPGGMLLACLAAVFAVASVFYWALRNSERSFERDWRDYDR